MAIVHSDTRYNPLSYYPSPPTPPVFTPKPSFQMNFSSLNNINRPSDPPPYSVPTPQSTPLQQQPLQPSFPNPSINSINYLPTPNPSNPSTPNYQTSNPTYPSTPNSITTNIQPLPPFSPSTTTTRSNTPIRHPIPTSTPQILSRSKIINSSHATHRKPAHSSKSKHQAVQLSLELKVERSKAFHAFFVPLARPLPGAPPSSPVLGVSSNNQIPAGLEISGRNCSGQDYFSMAFGESTAMGGGENGKVESCEEWVEDVSVSEGMDLDS